MALFTKKEVKEGKPIIHNILRMPEIDLLRGARWEDYSDKDFVSFVCGEDSFGPGFKKYFGSGNYNGNVSISYTPDYGYIKMDIYLGANTVSVATLKANADFASSVLGFEVEVMAPGTAGLTYPNVTVSKQGVAFSDLKLQVENMILAAASIVGA